MQFRTLLPLAAMLVPFCSQAADIPDIPLGTTLTIQGSSVLGNQDVQTAGFENDGTLTFTSINGGYSAGLTLTSGLLTNSATGVINILPGAGGERFIAGDVLNLGTITLDRALDFKGATFFQHGGKLVLNHPINFDQQTFDYAGGDFINGIPYLLRTKLKLNPAATNTVTFLMTGDASLEGGIGAKQTVVFQPNNQGGQSTLTIPDSLEIAGRLVIESANGGYNGTILGHAGEIRNSGTIELLNGAGGERLWNADLVNLGTIRSTAPLRFQKAFGNYRNAGNFTIESGRATLEANTQTFEQANGKLTIQGEFFIEQGSSFMFTGGEISGSPYLIGSELRLGTEPTGPGTIIMTRDGAMIRGNTIHPNQTIWVRGDATGGHTTVSGTELVNKGTIRLESVNGGYRSHLSVSGGLTNAASGTINIEHGAGGSRQIEATLHNQGTINVRHGETVITLGGFTEHVNRGIINIPAGGGLRIGTSQTFDQAGGSLNIAGVFDSEAIIFRYTGGTIVGEPTLLNSDLELGPNSGAAKFLVTGGSTKLRGNVNAGQIITSLGSARGGHSALTPQAGFQNNGTIILSSVNGGYSSAFNMGEGTFTNGPSGAWQVEAGNGGERNVYADMLNLGTVAINHDTTLAKGSAVYENRGTFTIKSGAALHMHGASQRFVQSAGVLRIDGGLNFNNVDVDLLGGRVHGLLYLNGSTLTLGPGATEPGEFQLTGSSQLFGSLRPGQTLALSGNARGSHSRILAPNGFSNSGTITLDSQNSGYYSILAAPPSTWLTNEANGTIRVEPGAGGYRELEANVLNKGLLVINTEMHSSMASNVFVNVGNIALNEGDVWNIYGEDKLFVQRAGTITNNGFANFQLLTFDYEGGVIVGPMQLSSATLNLHPTATAPVRFVLHGGSSKINGEIKAGQVVESWGSGRGSHARLTATNGLVNSGELTFTSENSGYYSDFSVTGGVFTNAARGVVNLAPGSGGPRLWAGNFVNQGTMNVNQTWYLQPLELGKVTSFLNEGELNISQTSYLDGNLTQVKGNTRLGDVEVTLSRGGTWLGGTLSGGAALIGNVTNGATVMPGNGIGRFWVRQGNYEQLTNGTVELEIASATSADKVQVDFQATLRGKLRVQLTGGFVPAVGASYEIVQAGTLTGSFSEYDLPALPTGRVWLLETNNNRLNLKVAGASATQGTISGIVRTTGGTAVAGAQVYAAPTGGAGSVLTTTTGADGRYTLSVPNGAYIVGLNGLANLGFNDTLPKSASINNNSATVDFAVQGSTQTLYNIAIRVEPSTVGAATGARAYANGATATLTAAATSTTLPWRFAGWFEGGILQSPNATYTFTVNRDRSLVAMFELPQYTINTTVEPQAAGSVSGEGVYLHGNSVILVATPAFGYAFKNWTDGGTVVGTTPQISFAASADRTLRANFSEANLTHVVTTATLPSGLAAVTGAGAYNNGQSATISAPNALTNGNVVYTFTHYTLNGNWYPVGGASFVESFTTTDPTNMHFVAEYSSRSLTPLVYSVEVNHQNPVPATTNLQLTIRFDRTMDASVQPVITFNNRSGGAAAVATPGKWQTWWHQNDSYVTGPIVLSAGMDGTNDVIVASATAADGQKLASTNVLQLEIDATPPQMAGFYVEVSDRTMFIRWSATEKALATIDLGVTTNYGLRIESPSWYSTNHTFDLFNTDLDPGVEYHYRVELQDIAGNKSVSTDRTIRPLPDNTQPETILVSGPAEGVVVCSLPINVRWVGADDRTRQERLQYAHRLTLAGQAAGAFGSFSSATELNFTNLAPGNYVLEIAARDVSGNVDATPVRLTFGFDNAAPRVNNLLATATASSFTVGWKTDKATTAKVEYGTTSALGQSSPLDEQFSADHSFAISGLLPNTKYFYRVTSSDACGKTTTSAIAEVTTKPAPDLAISQVSAAANGVLQAGAEIELRWTVSNTGAAATDGPWYDLVTVSNKTRGKVLLQTAVPYTGAALGAQSSAQRSMPFTLPTGNDGAGELVVTVDADTFNNLAELNATGNAEANNSRSATVNSTAVATPDLVVSGLAVQSATNLVTGSTYVVGWELQNGGNAAVTNSFTERLVVKMKSNGNILVSDVIAYDVAVRGNIAAGASKARSTTFTLPNGPEAVGELEVSLTTDVYAQVIENNAEDTGESNNSQVIERTSELGKYADLVVSDITAPATASGGRRVMVIWTLHNAGDGAVNGEWTDQIFLSEDANFGNDAVIGWLTTKAVIAANARLVVSNLVTLPEFGSGDRWIVVKSDVANEIYELRNNNNTAIDDAAMRIGASLNFSLSQPRVGEGASASLTISRNTDTRAAVEVALSATPAGQVTIPARVIIPAGETAVTVPISGAVDGNVDGDVNVTVRGTAGGFEPASGGLIVEDNDEAQLTIIVGAEGVAEGGRVNAMVRRNASAASALLVKLSSTLPEHISLPATVTIAAGQASAAFEITALSNDLPDGNLQVNLTASAENYGSGGGSIEFLDNDVPTLTLALSEKVISEGKANPAAELTITRSIVTDQEIFVLLSSSESGAATLPFGVSIPANEASARVKVNVTDDTTVDGSQTTRITAYVTDAVYRAPIEQGSAFVDVTVIDNDGPTLLITFNQDIISETGSGIAVVSRNTNPTNALTVALSSLDTGEATTPATVVIPVGATSAEFTVTGVKDNQPDGLQRVSIRATANGYTSGESAIGVTDIDLPDIRVVNATVPAGGLTSSSATIGFTVRNDGIAEASGPWFDRIYLSTSPGGENLQPVGQVLRTGRLAIGATYDRNAVIALPTKPGTYYVVIVTDADEVLSEGGKLNNTHIARTPIVVNPAYRATVQAQLESAPAGTPIPLRGRAFKANNEPAPNVGVTVRLTVQGIRREIPVRTDAQGNFETVFRPFLNEAGRVTVGADHPGVEEDPAQDGFDLHGVRFRQDELNLVLFPTEEVTGEIPIENLADLPASGLAFTLEGVPAGVTMQLRPTSTSLSPLNQRMVAYTIVAGPRTNRLDLRAAIKMTTAQGAVAYLPLNVTVAPHQPVLVANPGFLYTGMLRGTQKIVEFEVSNTGGAQSGPVTLMVPPVAWLKAASETNLPSIKPGETVKFALSLTPPANMPLERFDGSVLVRAENASVEVPFQFRAISEARGDFKIEVRDDYTYNVKGEPKVQGATVRLNDGLSGDLIASGVTGADGTLTLTNLMEGSYQLTVTAEKHGNYRTPITIVPGILTEHSAFIDVQTVSYRWTVVPTHIEDRYQVVLEPVFETEVPVPVVTIDNPLMLPLIVEGRETQFEVRLSNHGLIQAEKISIELPEHPEVEFRSLVDVVEVLPAKSSIAIPIIAKAKPGAQFASYPSARERMIRLASRSSFTGCEEVPKLQAKWSYVCGPDRRWHSNGGEIGFVSVDEDCWDKIKDHAGEAAGGNPKDLMDLKGQALGLAGVLADCVDPCLGTIVNLALGVATRDAKGAIGAAMGMGNCICPEIPYTGTPTGGGIPYVHGWVSGGGSGGGGSYDYPTPAPVNWAWPEFPCNPGDEIGGEASLSVAGINALSTTSSPGSVCARVRLRIEQEAVITRAAFLGTLEIENGNDLTTLSNIQVSIDIRAVSQESAADMFATRGPELKGITSVDGSGMLAPGAVGSAQYTFIPRREAAANGPTVYKIGGTLRYTEGTNVVEAPLLPDTITVYPDPVLNLVYFQQRDVYSDDPHTDPIEPAEPFALGLLVKNSGKGAALNFKITSGQPKIIENEKGLLIDFKIIGTQVGDQPATPSLSADLGRIEAGEGKVAIWNMISTLQGKFVEYNATFEHIDGLGDKRLSLIDSVEVHELIHVVRGDRPIDDTVADFLVNDQPDPNNTPDAIYFSHNGSVSPVNTAANVQVEVQQDGVTAKLTGSATTGWNYFKALDPMGGLRLYKVTRSDNKQVQLGFNAWTTSRSFPASQAGARYENLVHIVDFNSTGSYTLHYRFYDGSVPSVLGITPLAAVQNAAVDSIEVEFSKEIDLATLTRADLELTLNGVTNTSAFNVTATLVRPGVYQISGLAGATSGDGNYTVTIRGAGVADATGAAGSGVATVRWAKSSGAPVVAQLTEFDPIVRRAPVTSVQVQFSEAIDATTFDSADLALRLNGGVNLSSALAVITKVDDTTFNITGLGAVSAAEGEYSLTINAAGVKTPAGVAGKGALTTRWVVDANGPQVVELEKPSTNPRNIVVPSLEVRFNEPIDAATFTHADVSLTRNGGANLVTSAVSVARITDTRYRIENFNWVSGLEGNYVLTVNAAGISDPAGNPGRGTASTSWTLDLGKPAAPVRLAISPDLGASSSDALTSAKSVTFTGSVSETNLTVRLYDISTRADLGPATVSGTNFTKALELTAGQHRIRVHASDSAANVSGDSFLDVFVDLVGPNAALQEIDTLRSNGLPALEITFNEAIHAATFTKADVTLSREGIAVSLPASAEILFASSNTYRISGLATVTDTPGLYNLSVDLKGVQDLAGNSGSTNVSRTWRRVGANTPPSLAAISSKVVGADTLLVFTNSASDADIPRNRLRFTLEPGAPAGAAVNATNGVFTWRPTRAQAAQTFHVAIRVTDDGSPALSDVKSFTVQVTDYVDARVGQSVVLAGASGSVPLEIFSSAALTNITFTFSAPAELRGVQVEGWVPEIANVELVQGAGAPASHGLWSARISAATGKVFQGNQTLAQIQFTSAQSDRSMFANVRLQQVVASKPDGTTVGTTYLKSGRVVILHSEPILEAELGAGGSRRVRLFGRADASYRLQTSNRLNPGGVWGNGELIEVDPALLMQEISLPNGAGLIFYRAVKAAPGPLLPGSDALLIE